MWSRLEPDKRRSYDYLEVLGHIKEMVVPLPQQRDNRLRFEDQLFATLPDSLKDCLRSYAGEYYCADADIRTYNLSVLKMDKGPVRKYKHTEMWRKAKEFLYRVYDPLFSTNTRVCASEELVPLYNLDSSAGVPLQQAGLKKKKDALASGYARSYMGVFGQDYVPVWRVSGKREWLHASDIDAGKLRTFIIPPFKLLHQQKRFFHSQNMAMKMFHWSAYGFNPYQGGVNAMAEKLLVNPIFVVYDVKGWDRLVPVMKTCYKFRNTFHKGQAARAASLVGDMTCTTVLVLSDGSLVIRRNGNCSGSGCTTNDNIICHSFILAYILLTLFDGNEDLVHSVVAFLFGDDDALSLPDVGISDERIRSVFVSGFGDFGLELDPFVVTRSLSEAEFLGFTFLKRGTTWMPQFKSGRLLAAFCYEYDSKVVVSASLSKAYALMVMSYPAGGVVYAQMRAAYKRYCRDLKDDTDPVVLAYVGMGVPSDAMIDNFYSGRELNCVADLFSLEGLEEYNIFSYVRDFSGNTRREVDATDGRQQGANPPWEGILDCGP